MKRITTIAFGGLLVALLFAGISSSAVAKTRVFACEPQWASVAREIGGEHVRVDSATTAHQDVHYIQARPSLIAKLRRADLLVCSGADLEIGWLPVLLRQARNAKVQPGTPGYLDVSRIVPMLDVPSQIDRSAGDIHPYGNPHTQTDPHNIALVAAELAGRLAQIDPSAAEDYRARQQDFAARWQKALAGWEKRATPLRGVQVITHHLAWVYMAHWLGLDVVDHLEAKPGIPPTAGHLAELLQESGRRDVRVIIRATYQSERPSKWLCERADIPAVVVPHCVGATEGARDLFSMYDDMLDRLLEAIRK